MDISFYICAPNAIGDIRVIVHDRNNNLQTIFDQVLGENQCGEAIGRANNDNEADIEYSLNGGASFKQHRFIKAGDRVDVF